MLITDALARFTTQLDADGRSIHTRKQYSRHIGSLITWAAARDLHAVDHLTPELIAEFLTSTVARNRADGAPKKASSVNALRTSVRCFSRFLHDSGMTTSNPARLLRLAVTSPPPPRAMTKGECDRFLAAIRAAPGEKARRDDMLFSLMLATGVRLSSALRLDVEEIDFDEASMRVWTKRDRVQVVYLERPMASALRKFVEGQEGPVFIGSPSVPLGSRSAQRRFVKWRVAAGISAALTPHSLRHTFAIQLYQRTGDILVVRAALGHLRLTSVLTYLHAKRPGDLSHPATMPCLQGAIGLTGLGIRR